MTAADPDALDRLLDAPSGAARDAARHALAATPDGRRRLVLAAALAEPPGDAAPDVRAAVLARLTARAPIAGRADPRASKAAARGGVAARAAAWLARHGLGRGQLLALSTLAALVALAVIVEAAGGGSGMLAGMARATLPPAAWLGLAFGALVAAAWIARRRRRD